LILCVSATFATDDEGKPEVDEPPRIEEQVTVRGELPNPATETLDLENLDDARAVNLALAFEDRPGIAAVRRAANAAEPVIRGLGWERVQTQVNGLPLSGACPARMDPPACIVNRCAVRRASVIKGLASVTLGPAGTGGRLDLSTDFDRGDSPGREIDPWTEATYDGARSGYVTAAGLDGGLETVDLAAGVEILRHNDYSSASGIEVPAGQDETGAYLSLGQRVGSAGRWRLGVVAQDGEDIDYPSLPMNSEESDTRLYDGGYRYRPATVGGLLSEMEFRLGYADVSHFMSNRGKPNRATVEAEATSDAQTWSAGVTTRLSISATSMLELGVDYTDLERDALRERLVLASGTTFYDHLWPDVSQEDLGAFAEIRVTAARAWNLRFGLRYDGISSAASAADDPGLGGRTIRENYVWFYGPGAAVTDRDEDLFSGNVLVVRDLGKRWSVHGGFGLVSRSAGMTERYFSFAPAPNGFVVGNPALDAERKREIAAGARYAGERVELELFVYHHDVADFIHSTVLDSIDVNGDGTLDLIRGFKNVDATLYGAEASARIRVNSKWSVPTAAAYVHGENDTAGVPLPEIPSFEGRAAVRYGFAGRTPGWVELGGRFVDRQDRVDTAFGEDETPGFAVWHLRGRFDVGGGIELQVGVENLLDKEYHDHLTREAIMPVGGLGAGDEIPQPGRSLVVGVRYR
jgi:iron complex outermembrane receptor protein